MRRLRALGVLFLIVLMITAPVAFCEQELLQDGGFEGLSGDAYFLDWDYDAWQYDEGYTEFGMSEEGRGGLCAHIVNYEENDARFIQSVKVEPDTAYVLSGYIKAQGAYGDFGANLSVGNTYVATEPVWDTEDEWTFVQVHFLTGARQKKVDIYARLGGYSATCKGEAWFDDLSLVPFEGDTAGFPVVDTQSQKNDTEKSSQQAAQSGNYVPLIILLAICALILFVGLYQRLRIEKDVGLNRVQLLLIALAAFLLRLVIAAWVHGYPNDIGCFQGWAEQAVKSNLFFIYRDAAFLDYPPGYLYVLYPVGWLNRLLGLTGIETLQVVGVKLPAIIADMISAGLIFKFARTRWDDRKAGLLALLYLFNPMVLLDSAAWGQIDSILTLFILLSLFDIQNGKFVRACILYGVGLMFKPQMLMLAPLFLCALIVEMRNAPSAKAACKKALFSLGGGLAAIVLIALPFWLTQSPDWIIRLFTGTMSQYAYGSVNAANLAMLFGGNWTDVNEKVLFFSYKVWGTLGICSVCGYIFYRYVLKDRDHRNLFVYAAMLLAGIFTLGHMMHERYMFPVIGLLLVAFIDLKDKRLLFCFAGFSLVQFLNCGIVLSNLHLPVDKRWLFSGLTIANPIGGEFYGFYISLLCVLCFVYLVYTQISLGREEERFAPYEEALQKSIDRPKVLFAPTEEGKLPWTKRDTLLMLGLTLIYALFAFFYLGTTKVPQTMWQANKTDDYVVIDLGMDYEISAIRRYYGLSKGEISLYIAPEDAPEDWSYLAYWDDTDNGDMYIWEDATPEGFPSGRFVLLNCDKPTSRLLEVAFYDVTGALIPNPTVSYTNLDAQTAAALIDEQNTVPEIRGVLNQTYFDEIYHARTAWEFIEGLRPYETTHPPLGKIMISWGIRLFGMTPFGWRFTGTVIGILMVPLMYLFGMMLFRKTRYAFLTAFFMSTDFMHLAHTRIATIDSYSTFFIIAMYAAMYAYLRHNFNREKLWKTLLPLGACGVLFGLGAASKWTCLYAGAGLAVIFFYSLYKRGVEYAMVRQGIILLPEEEEKRLRARFVPNVILTLLWCVLFFIVVPIGIYLLSYIPFVRGQGPGAGKTITDYIQVVWENQKSMFSYHSGLVDDHFFQSPWYQWPFNFKPIFMYKNYDLPQGMMGSIASFGNPLIWLTGTAAILATGFKVADPRRKNWLNAFLLVSFLTQFVPWILVPRSMFIYHYFSSVPFFIAMTVLCIKELEESGRLNKRITLIFCAAAVVLFIAFYPVLTGIPIPSAYGKLLRWLPSWYFVY